MRSLICYLLGIVMGTAVTNSIYDFGEERGEARLTAWTLATVAMCAMLVLTEVLR